jgi:voltage-gated potassium channel Kch
MNTKRDAFLKDLDVEALLGKEQEADIPRDLPMRKWLYSWLLDPNIPGNFQKAVDKWISYLIIANLFTLMFEHVPAVFEPNKHWFEWFDIFSVAVFTIEYLLRLYLAPEDEEFKNRKNARLGFVTSPFAIIDFLAVAPFYLQSFIPIDLRILRLLRLLRILKLFRVLIPAIAEFKELNKNRTFRQKVHALVFPSQYGGTMQHIFEVFIAIWVLLSVLAVILESVKSIQYILHLQFVILDAVAVAIFTIEYAMRIYSCVEEPGYKGSVLGRLKQAKSPSTFIDFLAILPFFLEVFLHHLFDLRFLRVFRLARLLKLTRGSDATAVLVKVVVREWPVMSAATFIMMLLLVLTASLGYLFEYDAQPEKFENIPTSIYWAVITLASVGYGDISPVTPVGRALTSILALLGIGIFAIPAALLASAFSDELVKERDALKANLFSILKDGHISDEEAVFIRAEAKRLHLTTGEINALIDVVIKEHELEERNPLPIHKIAENPALAVEHYKVLLGQIRQLGVQVNASEFDAAAQQGERLSASEFALWQKIQGKA